MDPPQINYIDNKSMLVINSDGKMRQIFVPFRVQVIYNTVYFKYLSWVIVEEVLPDDKYRIIYRIGKQWWPYQIFKIAVVF